MQYESEEMAPPWAKFPTYEVFSIGWRMGEGEDYLYAWRSFLAELDTDFEARLSYLRRHCPAPLNWCEVVIGVLYPEADTDQEFVCSESEKNKLLEMGLIAVDAAYETWLLTNREPAWPWLWRVAATPEQAARYQTREFWFFSRQLQAARARGELVIPQAPERWLTVEMQLKTGELGAFDPDEGLLSLARMLCAGKVVPPWELGCKPEDFADSVEMNMGYVDAYRLWLMSAFDDEQFIQASLLPNGTPDTWSSWMAEHAVFN